MWSVDRLLEWGKGGNAQIDGNPGNRPIVGFSINTQTLQPDEIFIALKGTKQDGHHFVEEAFRKGAAGAMVARSWFASRQNLSQSASRSHFMIVVDDPLVGLQALAKWHRQSFECPLIGITGSNGKTTTKEMLANILARRGPILKTEGNLNNHIGLPLTLLRLGKGDQAVVLEMGISRPGDMRLLCEIAKPTVGIITNIGPAHLEFLSNAEGVAAEKGVLFETMASGGIAIINKDDPYLSQWEGTLSEKWTYSIGGDADATASEIEQYGNGIAFTLTLNRNHKGGGGKMKVVLSLLGEHQVYNALAASAAALALGYEFDEIRSALREIRPIPLRGEMIAWNGATILLDAYNANPASMKAGIQTLAGYVTLAEQRRKVAILGDMLELGNAAKSAHRDLGRKVAQHRIDRLITVGKFSAVVAQAAEEEGMGKETISAYENLKSVDLAHEIQKGDIVLIKGSRGMRMERLLDSPQECTVPEKEMAD
ncbi:MAG: UDP-N-acetylmuramoyl-tripeptide--D-alanyl-D-alanine ligase [Nitrospirae bacterium]|nr:UDP-N-acetylmuramoyl-tripeptide--D-alanyl-D-alanine ligase [Candidatus Troglogloeales bacterium]MBI3598023.1 UDP-N-acetylmuramoyl-tripeptide--D-alanyl-D-alanine ligase [Candidatus Troglogloeales bacterium]